MAHPFVYALCRLANGLNQHGFHVTVPDIVSAVEAVGEEMDFSDYELASGILKTAFCKDRRQSNVIKLSSFSGKNTDL